MKVSNYSIAKYLIDSATKKYDCSFVDMTVVFGDDFIGMKDNKICVGNSDSWGAVVFNIISVYFDNFKEICGKEIYIDERDRDFVLLALSKFMSKLTKNDNILDEARSDEPILMRLYQYPVVWMLMKDIICPACQITYENVLMAFVKTVECDIATFVDDPDYLINDEVYIAVNDLVEYPPVRDVFIFGAVLEAHGQYPIDIIQLILNGDLKKKVESVVKLAYGDDEKVEDFMQVLTTYGYSENKIESLVAGNVEKTASVAKAAQDANGSFWYFGLIEKLIEPTRGSDWSTYEHLHPWFEEMQAKINAAREKAGKDGVTFEYLLRIKDGENSKKENNTVMERRLKKNRVW